MNSAIKYEHCLNAIMDYKNFQKFLQQIIPNCMNVLLQI